MLRGCVDRAAVRWVSGCLCFSVKWRLVLVLENWSSGATRPFVLLAVGPVEFKATAARGDAGVSVLSAAPPSSAPRAARAPRRARQLWAARAVARRSFEAAVVLRRR